MGAGPAGRAAALTTAHRGLTTLVIEAKDQPGVQPQFLYPDKQIVDVPSFPDEFSSEEFFQRLFLQAEEALVQFRFGEEFVTLDDTLETDSNQVSSLMGTRILVGVNSSSRSATRIFSPKTPSPVPLPCPSESSRP